MNGEIIIYDEDDNYDYKRIKIGNGTDNVNDLDFVINKEVIDTDLNGKADKEHSHTIADVTNLQSSLDAKVPTSRTINGKALSSNITLSASDVSAYTKTEIDDMEFITTADIDTICGGTIQVARINEVTF